MRIVVIVVSRSQLSLRSRQLKGTHHAAGELIGSSNKTGELPHENQRPRVSVGNPKIVTAQSAQELSQNSHADLGSDPPRTPGPSGIAQWLR